MPRPTSKAQLLDYSRVNFEKLQKEIADLSPEQKIDPGVIGDWSIKDVLAHLLEWQRMTQSWYAAGKRGEKPVTPSEDYTWREIPALNQHIYKTYKDRPLDEIECDFLASHNEMMALIEMMDDEELFTPQVYEWTKTTTLGSYFTSPTSSHYDWARKEIRRGLKAKRK